MAEAELLTIADELFGLPLGDFTPARDARAKELKADKTLSAAVKALRKPSLAAWVVNLMVRRDAEQVAQVLAVGEALREAQATLDGGRAARPDQAASTADRRRDVAGARGRRRRGRPGHPGGGRPGGGDPDGGDARRAAPPTRSAAGCWSRPWRRPGWTRSTWPPRWRCRRRSASRPARARPQPSRGPSCTSYPTRSRTSAPARRRQRRSTGPRPSWRRRPSTSRRRRRPWRPSRHACCRCRPRSRSCAASWPSSRPRPRTPTRSSPTPRTRAARQAAALAAASKERDRARKALEKLSG